MQSASPTHAKIYLIFAGLFGCTAVLFSAWASHALEGQEQEWAEIATRYQFIHCLALFALGIWHFTTYKMNITLGRLPVFAGYFWIIGIFLFSGNLVLLAITNISSLGFLTPFGGVSMAFGWLLIAITAMKLK